MKLVVLDNLYANVHSALAGELFLEIIRMRASAYDRFYSERYLPTDPSDFICTHYLLCTLDTERLVPQCGFKHVTLERCDAYHVTFPLWGFVQPHGSPDHRAALDCLIDHHRSTGYPLVYGGHIAIRRPMRDRTLPLLLRELAASIIYKTWKTNKGFTEVAASSLRTRTDAWFEKIGFRPIEWRGLPLEALSHPLSPALLMELREPTAWARDCFEKHCELISSACLVSAQASERA